MNKEDTISQGTIATLTEVIEYQLEAIEELSAALAAERAKNAPQPITPSGRPLVLGEDPLQMEIHQRPSFVFEN